MSFRPFLALAVALALTAESTAQTGYSNVTTYTTYAFSNSDATLIGSNTVTALVADDIQVAAGFQGGSVTGFTFSVGNLDTAAVSARPRVRFYAADGTTGLPSTFLGGLDFNPISFTAGSVSLFNFNPGTEIFTVPANGLFWAGITFDDNNGATGATATQLSNLGQGIFDPPTVGTSADGFFWSDVAGDFASNDPAGDIYDFGGDPKANFGWAFTVVPVPEPSGVFAASLLAVTAGRWVRRRRAAV